MTFRRVMLVVLPLLGAVFIFTVLWYVYADWEASLVPGGARFDGPVPRMPTGKEEIQTVQEVGHEVSTNVNLIRRDTEGRMEMRFLADRIEHKDKTSTDIDRPRIQFFTKDGRIVTLLADQGHAVTKGALTNVDDIESGRLWGNVVLVDDRGTPDDLADDILVGLEDVVFDNERYEMSTDGPVVMAGPEMSLSARKMQMALDRDTRRINTMTFFHDVFITFEAGVRMRVSLSAPADEAPPPTSPPAEGPATPADEAGDLWRIDLADDVFARQDDQNLRCDRLILYNEAQGGREPAGPGGTQADGQVPPGTTAPPEPRKAAKAAESTPTGPLVVIANGPLIITPVGADERKVLGDEQRQVTATGSPVVIEDGETRIVGDVVRYNAATASGTVIGKDGPMLLEQPGRLHLTGGRLDFNRRALAATIQGEGSLQARVTTASLTGSTGGATAEKTPAEPSVLDASWKRGMHLEFYSLPSDQTEGMGEIKRAEFHGKAVVNQAEGILRGEDLAIDFVRAEPGRGQTVERLVGHGDVYLKNAPPKQDATVTPTAKDAPETTIGDIACQDLDIQFAAESGGGAQPKRLDAAGGVAINDTRGRIRAEKLSVAFGRTEKGTMDARFLEAFGDVLIDRDDLHAEGDHVRRDTTAGTLLLEGKPARAKSGGSRIVGARIEFSEADGRASVRGPGELEMPATTDLRGRPRDTPQPLLVQWENGMLFEDQRNFAHFNGKVRTVTGGSRLNAERLWIYFADRPEPPADPAAAEPPKKASAGDEMGNLFGRKALVRLLAEQKVLAIDGQLADDGTVRHQMEIVGDNLTYLEENRKAYVRGPGRLRILAREKPKTGEPTGPGIMPKQVEAFWKDAVLDGYARTTVGWVESMAYDGASGRAYFKGDVDATHAGRGVPGGGESRRAPTGTRITSRDLQVVFGQKVPDAASATPAATLPPVTPATPQQERMTVEKLVADGSVLLWVDDRRGSAARLIYQREPEMIRLYRGPGADEWARLWQENEATQEFGEIAARTITYDPSTGRVDVIDQQVITVTPRPKIEPKPVPKLVPGTRR